MAKFEFSSSFQHVKNISISFFSRNIGLGEEPLINLVSSKNITMFLKPVNFLKIYLIKFTLKGYSTMEVMLNYRETDKLQSRVTHTKGTSKVYIQNQTCLCVLINTRHVIFFFANSGRGFSSQQTAWSCKNEQNKMSSANKDQKEFLVLTV